MTIATPLLTVQNLTVGFKSTGNILFKNLELSLTAGKLVCFMGPNGIGKSTLLRTLSGLQTPIAGNIHLPAPEKPLSKTIAVVLTNKLPLPGMSVYQLVSYGRYPYLDWNLSLSADDHARIQAALDAIGISGLSNANIQELSDGQLQMAMIARALCQETSIIMLDEPTAHLDLNNRLEIMKHLKKFAREMNKAILVSTHELDLALQISDEVWLASREKSILTGTPEDLVLNGAFDDIFRFKGFDLRTGRINHPVHQEIPIKLIGSGHDYLWTKNALARCGYEVVENDPMIGQKKKGITVSIEHANEKPQWIIESMKQQYRFSSIKDLIEGLDSNVCKIPE